MRKISILALALVAGCATAGTPADFGIVPVPMPNVAPEAYNDVVQCAGVTNPPVQLSAIAWHIVDRQYIPGKYGGSGLADINTASIYVVARRAHDKKLWAHEIAHILLQTTDHPAIFRRCGWMAEGIGE